MLSLVSSYPKALTSKILFSSFYFVFNAKCTKQSAEQGLEPRCLSDYMNLML